MQCQPPLDANSSIFKISELINYGKAIQSVGTDIEVLSAATKGLTLDQTLNALSTNNLSKEELEAILSANGFTDAEVEQTVALTGSKVALDSNTASLSAYGTGLKAIAKEKIVSLFSSPIPYIVIGTAAIYAMVKASDYLHGADKRLAEAHTESITSIKDSITENNNLKSEMESLQSQYNSNIEKIGELNELRSNGTISSSESEYLDKLEQQNGKLQKQIEYKQTLADLAAKENENDSVSTLKEKTQTGVGHDDDGNTVEVKLTDTEKIEQNTSVIEQNTKRLIAYKNALTNSLTQDDIDYFTKARDNAQKALDSAIKSNDDMNISNYEKQVKELDDILSNGLNYDEYEKGVSGLNDENQKLVSENNELLESVEPLNEEIVSTTGKNAELKNSNNEIIASAKDAANAFNDATDSLDTTSETVNNTSKDTESAAMSAEDLATAYKDLNSAIDDIQSVYSSLQSAVEEYNSQGYLSLDTLQSLMDLDDSYLACLVEQNGQMSINDQMMQALAQSKLDAAQASAVNQAMTELEAITNGEYAKSTTDYVNGNANLVNSLAVLTGSYDSVANAAMTAAQAQALSASVDSASGVNKTATQNVMAGLNAKLKLIQGTKASISAGNFNAVVTKPSTSSKSAKSDADDAEKLTKDYADAMMKMYKAEAEAGKITYKDYVDKTGAMLTDMYKNGKLSAVDYFNFIEDKLNTQMSMYKSVLSAVSKVYDNEIKEAEKKKQAIQDVIDSMSEENDERQRNLDLQKAIYEWARANSQRSKYVLKDGQFVYETDTTAIQDAKKSLDDAKYANDVAALKKQQDSIDDYIDHLNDLKDQWSDVASEYEEQQDKMNAINILGANFENDVLNGRLDTLTNFKNQFVSLQQEMADAAVNSANAQVEAANNAAKATSTSGSSVASPSQAPAPTPTPQKQEEQEKYYVYKTLGTYQTNGQASSKVGMLGGDEVIHIGNKYMVVKWKEGYPTYGQASSNISSFGGNGVYKRYKKGGMLSGGYDTPYLDALAKSIGEDHIATVGFKDGERILTANQNDMWEKWTNAMPDLVKMVNPLQNLSVPKFDFETRMNSSAPVVQNIELVLPNVTNNSGYERIQKELRQMQIDARQMANK